MKGDTTMLQEPVRCVACEEEGFYPAIFHGEWLVGFLNYRPDLTYDHISSMQKHTQTDEIFVLLSGKCILYYSEAEDAPADIKGTLMESGKAYVITQGIWHTQIMAKGTKILIVENRDTTLENSPRLPLSEKQIQKVKEIAQGFHWGCK